MPDMTIPQSDSKFRDFAEVFCKGIERAPSVYGLFPSDGASLRQAFDEFDAAYQIAWNRQTRTPPNVNVKDTTRNSLRDFIRTYAALIRPNKGVSDADKLAIGIHIAKTYPTLRKCPQTTPRLSFIAMTPGRHTLHYADSLNPSAKAKPFGADRLELCAAFVDPEGEEVPTSPPEDAKFLGSFTRRRMDVEYPIPPRPMLIVYWGRWAGARGETGPWSLGCPAGIVGKCKAVEKMEEQARKKKRKRSTDGGDDADSGESGLKIAA